MTGVLRCFSDATATVLNVSLFVHAVTCQLAGFGTRQRSQRCRIVPRSRQRVRIRQNGCLPKRQHWTHQIVRRHGRIVLSDTRVRSVSQASSWIPHYLKATHWIKSAYGTCFYLYHCSYAASSLNNKQIKQRKAHCHHGCKA